MNISHDGISVRFKTKPEELFLVEKSGAKSNTVRILDLDEWKRINACPPKKIIIQNKEQEVFIRTLTNISKVGVLLGKVVAIFSWTTEKHPMTTESSDPKAHIVCLEEARKDRPNEIAETAIWLPRTLIADLNRNCGKSTAPKFISKLLELYLAMRAEEGQFI